MTRTLLVLPTDTFALFLSVSSQWKLSGQLLTCHTMSFSVRFLKLFTVLLPPHLLSWWKSCVTQRKAWKHATAICQEGSYLGTLHWLTVYFSHSPSYAESMDRWRQALQSHTESLLSSLSIANPPRGNCRKVSACQLHACPRHAEPSSAVPRCCVRAWGDRGISVGTWAGLVPCRLAMNPHNAAVAYEATSEWELAG